MTSDILNFGTQEEFVMFLYFSLGPSEGQGASDTRKTSSLWFKVGNFVRNGPLCIWFARSYPFLVFTLDTVVMPLTYACMKTL